MAGFLILERNFPRSIRFSVRRRLAAISAIRMGTRGSTIDPAERILGRLDAQLEYAEFSEILTEGVSELSPAHPVRRARGRRGGSTSYFMH